MIQNDYVESTAYCTTEQVKSVVAANAAKRSLVEVQLMNGCVKALCCERSDTVVTSYGWLRGMRPVSRKAPMCVHKGSLNSVLPARLVQWNY